MRFKTIVADPPWHYGGGCWDRPKTRVGQTTPGATSNYKTLRLEHICSLPVESVCEDNAVLWLWTTNRHLLLGQAKEVAEAWGFRPITTVAWCKPQMGVGYYVRNSHENLLLAVRGSVRFKDRGIKSWFVADRRKHSKKPDVLYDLAERAFDGPYLELFARECREGWSVWGDEVGDPFGWGFDPEMWLNKL